MLFYADFCNLWTNRMGWSRLQRAEVRTSLLLEGLDTLLVLDSGVQIGQGGLRVALCRSGTITMSPGLDSGGNMSRRPFTGIWSVGTFILVLRGLNVKRAVPYHPLALNLTLNLAVKID